MKAKAKVPKVETKALKPETKALKVETKAPKPEPKSGDSDQFLLNGLDLPKDVRSLVDRLPMPKDKPDELIPIGKLLGK